jgi:hypothetical protein
MGMKCMVVDGSACLGTVMFFLDNPDCPEGCVTNAQPWLCMQLHTLINVIQSYSIDIYCKYMPKSSKSCDVGINFLISCAGLSLLSSPLPSPLPGIVAMPYPE